MDKKIEEKKEPIPIIILIFVNYIIGGGIALIGQRTKNKFEFYGGLAFIAAVIISQFVNALLFKILSIASWLYIIIRLILIWKSKETEIKLI